MILKAWVVACDTCSESLIFSRTRPRKIRDADKLYMEMDEIPTVDRSEDEILAEAVKQGWRQLGDDFVCQGCVGNKKGER